jgi:membrane protein implicated in regulation of membrane protease activity
MLNAVNPRRSFWLYTLIRIGLFALVLTLLLLLLPSIQPWISTVLAAIIAMCVSFIFLRRPREEVAKSLYEVRNRKAVANEDEDLEDTVVDAETDAASRDTKPDASSRDTKPDASN